mgnify:FL=1
MGRRCHVGRGSVVRREGLVRSWWGVLDVGSRGRIGLEAVPNRVLEYRLESRLAGERDRVRCTRGGSAKGGLASVKHEDFAEPRLQRSFSLALRPWRRGLAKSVQQS